MELLRRLGQVARASVVELRRGTMPGEVCAKAAKVAAVEVARAAVESDTVRAAASGAVLGATLSHAAGRLRADDIDGALDGLANGTATAAAAWKGGRR